MPPKEVEKLQPDREESLFQSEVVGLTRKEKVLLLQEEVVEAPSKIFVERARSIYPYEFFGIGFTRVEWYEFILM